MNKNILFAAAFTLVLAACSNDENLIDPNAPVEAKVVAGISGAVSTRVNGSTWQQDHIGIIATAVSGTTSGVTSTMTTTYTNSEYSTTSTSASATFSPVSNKIFFQDAAETVTFSAYAPYNSSISSGISLNTKDNNTTANQKNIDILYASGATAKKSSPTINFTFKHMMSRLKFTINLSTSDGFGSSDQISAVSLSGLKHSGTFYPSGNNAGTFSLGSATAVDNWDITSLYTNPIIVLPQSNASLALKITINSQTYSINLTPALESSKSYDYTITAKKTGLSVSGCTVTDWTSVTGTGDALM